MRKTPDAIALVFNQQRLTYCELNIRANQLAHHLQKLGIVPDRLVGICIDRSPETIIAILGILYNVQSLINLLQSDGTKLAIGTVTAH